MSSETEEIQYQRDEEEAERQIALNKMSKKWLLEPKENPYFTVEYRRFFDEGALAQAKKIAERLQQTLDENLPNYKVANIELAIKCILKETEES